jgi:Integrase core domain
VPRARAESAASNELPEQTIPGEGSSALGASTSAAHKRQFGPGAFAEVVIDDAQVFNEKLQEWEDYYNYHRPHGALGGQPPLRASKAKNTGPRVGGLCQLHGVGEGGLEPPASCSQSRCATNCATPRCRSTDATSGDVSP